MVRFFALLVTFSCILFSSAGVIAASPEECTNPDMIDSKCPPRPHIVNCAAKYLDLNNNKKLERSELETAIDNLPWYSRSILKVIGSIDKIMAKCDADGDGAIGIETDMPVTEETCLASCFKRKAFKSAFFPDCDEPSCLL
jgi:hypothetical protein